MAFDYLPLNTTQIDNFSDNEEINKDIKFIWNCIQYWMDYKDFECERPLSLDKDKPKNVNIIRELDTTGFNDFLQGCTKTTFTKSLKLHYNNIIIRFGDGSRKGKGKYNKGNVFEKVIFDDLNGIRNQEIEWDMLCYPDMVAGILNIVGLENFMKSEILATGNKNSNRPIQIKDDSIIIGKNEQNIGSLIADIVIKCEDKEHNISLKFGETTAMFNSGIQKLFSALQSEIPFNIDEFEKNKDTINLLKFFSIDTNKFVFIFRNFETFIDDDLASVDENVEYDKTKMEDFLMSGIGYNYIMAHRLNPSHAIIYQMDEEKMREYANIQSYKIYYGGKTGKGKRITIEILTDHLKFQLQFRNKSDTKNNFPSHIVGDYRYLK